VSNAISDLPSASLSPHQTALSVDPRDLAKDLKSRPDITAISNELRKITGDKPIQSFQELQALYAGNIYKLDLYHQYTNLKFRPTITREQNKNGVPIAKGKQKSPSFSWEKT